MSKFWNRIGFTFSKIQAPTNDEGTSNKILKILEMRPISIKKHEWTFVKMVPISTTKHKMTFGNLGTFIILGSIQIWNPEGDNKTK